MAHLVTLVEDLGKKGIGFRSLCDGVRGRTGGRKKISPDNPKVLTAKCIHKNHGMSIDDICKTLKIYRASFYRYLSLHEESMTETAP